MPLSPLRPANFVSLLSYKLLANGVAVGRHEADLHFLASPEARKIVQDEIPGAIINSFRSDLPPNDTYNEVPFIFMPDGRKNSTALLVMESINSALFPNGPSGSWNPVRDIHKIHPGLSAGFTGDALPQLTREVLSDAGRVISGDVTEAEIVASVMILSGLSLSQEAGKVSPVADNLLKRIEDFSAKYPPFSRHVDTVSQAHEAAKTVLDQLPREAILAWQPSTVMAHIITPAQAPVPPVSDMTKEPARHTPSLSR